MTTATAALATGTWSGDPVVRHVSIGQVRARREG